VHVTYRPISDADIAGDHGSVIGKAIPDLKVYILDAYLQPVPIGVAGELYIGGAGVARGYLNRPELTAERFIVPSPACGRGCPEGAGEGRLYKTGDLARFLPDGNIEYLGRNDFQVKIRGFRIELGEIEAALVKQPGIREAVVLAREDIPGDKRLAAYLIPSEPEADKSRHPPGWRPLPLGVGWGVGGVGSHDANTIVPPLPHPRPLSQRERGENLATLRAALQGRLPAYMLPAAFVVLDAFPLTPNGKLDRKALPAPDHSALASAPFESPQGAIEEALAQIWREVLGVERVSRHDNFFDLGGHSLLAVQVISRLRQTLGVEVPLRELFAQPNLSALAQTVSEAHAAALPPIERANRDGDLPVSLAQRRLWFLEQMGGVGSAYHIPGAVRLRGPLDELALQASLNEIVARHESLRTTFRIEKDGPCQHIAASGVFALQSFDLCYLPETAQQVELERHLEEEANSAFDLAHGPLIRGRFLKLDAEHHALLITMHHIVSDGWSMGVLIREFATLYAAYSQGDASPLPPLSVQYADYAVWQRQWLAGERLQAQLDYWHNALSGAPELLELPSDRPRPAEQSYAGASLPVLLPERLTAQLKALAREQNATLFMVLLAGWAVTLSRLAGQDDIVIGSPIAGRQQLEVESLIGFFINTLALRVRLDDNPSVEALLEQVKETTLSAYAHQDVPFEQVVEVLQPRRSLSHSPLFQVMFALQNTPESSLEVSGLTLQGLGLPRTTAQFDLSLSVQEAGDTLVGSLDYATSLFERGTVERFIRYWQTLLEGMVETQQQRVGELPLINEVERQQILIDFNQTGAPYPQDQLIHELFEAQVARTPQATAVVFAGETLSYAELNARANQLAHALRAQGVGSEGRVAICVERGLEMIVGILGILKAGGGYVPLDPVYPQERLAYMLADARPKAVLTQAGLQAILPALDVPVILLDAHESEIAQQSTDNPDPKAWGLTSQNLAYVIYTSGSTGQPKGVMVEHQEVCNFVTTLAGMLGLQPEERVLQFASVNFDVSVEEIFSALLSGAGLVIRTDEWLSSEEFWHRCEVYGISFTHLPTSFWQQLIHDSETPIPTSLRQVMIGGEAVSERALERWFARAGYRPVLYNSYGPTEATVSATALKLDDARNWRAIGRPLANARAYILDANLQPVPIDVAGELFIGGAGVARGYLDRPGLTAERFIADPFSGDSGARLYKTGDLARFLPDGKIEYLGRNDFQVKIRGFRIELGEIEAALTEQPDVREAVVLAREDIPGNKRLVAYLVPSAPEQTPEAATLRAALQGRLPEYMVPSAYVVLDVFPLTPNGKLDRKALPAPDHSALVSAAFEAPQGEIEEALAQIWRDVLGGERISRHDNFFDLGGHSLLTVQLVGRIFSVFGVQIPIMSLFNEPTLQRLAEVVSQAQIQAPPQTWNAVVPIKPTGSRPPLFLIHPAGAGSVLCYAELASQFPPDQPLYGIQAAGMFGEEEVAVNLEVMAAKYVHAIRSVQERGPYLLGGWSAGGNIAYEMARQLTQSGETVAFLGLIDASGTQFGRPPSELALLLLAFAEQEGVVLNEEHLRSLSDDDQLQYLIDAVKTQGVKLGLGDFDFSKAVRVRDVFRGIEQALSTYVPQRYTGSADLFACTNAPGRESLDPRGGWQELVEGELRVHAVPGDHQSVVKAPDVNVLAEEILGAIDAALENTSVPDNREAA
jgi:amino acid adenylation domain-containing protein